MRLYGGAQYHRAMAEFRFVVGGIKCPPITREEIVNACGVEDIHDGTNYSRYPWTSSFIKISYQLILGDNISLLLIFLVPYFFPLENRTACVIAVAKARDSFEPFLHQVSCIGSCYEPLIASLSVQNLN